MEKETMKWNARCDISELPTRLWRLAEYRKEHTESNPLSADTDTTVNRFRWNTSPEGEVFWGDVYEGCIPDNLEEVLTAFEHEHPESTINWEQRRYEIAKECMAAYNNSNDPNIWNRKSHLKAEWAVEDADALIAKLKKHK